MATEGKMTQGKGAKDAPRTVRPERGNLEVTKEVVRTTSWESFVEGCWQDLRFAMRMLRKSPGFTAVAILTLALGVGANTAIFSLLDGLAFRNLAVPQPERLVRFGVHDPDDDFAAVSLPMFQAFTHSQKVFSATFAWWGDSLLNVETDGVLSRSDVWCIDGNFYTELGATPEVGRLFDPNEENVNTATAAQVVVLGHGFWQSHYGGAQNVIGKTLKIEGMPFTIIGVTRKGFSGITADREFELTLPITAEPLIAGHLEVQKYLQRRDALWLQAAGRLKPGVALQQARAELESLWPGIQQDMAPLDKTLTELNYFRGLRLKVESASKGTSFLRDRFTTPLYVLLAISGIVLLIACANLGSLLLARAASRNHEMGVRAALGAGRSRLVRQMFTESIMLSLIGTLAGFAVAHWGSQALSDFILRQMYVVPAGLNLSPDWRVLGFTTGVAVLTGVLFGLAPSWRASREDPNTALQHGSRTLGGGASGLGKRLIVTQMVLSVVLLVCAGLFIRSLEKLNVVELGFRTRTVLDVSLFPKPQGYKNLALVSYYRELTDNVLRLPGVESAGIAHMSPGNLYEWKEKMRMVGTRRSKRISTGPFCRTGLSQCCPCFSPHSLFCWRVWGFTD